MSCPKCGTSLPGVCIIALDPEIGAMTEPVAFDLAGRATTPALPVTAFGFSGGCAFLRAERLTKIGPASSSAGALPSEADVVAGEAVTSLVPANRSSDCALVVAAVAVSKDVPASVNAPAASVVPAAAVSADVPENVSAPVAAFVAAAELSVSVPLNVSEPALAVVAAVAVGALVPVIAGGEPDAD